MTTQEPTLDQRLADALMDAPAEPTRSDLIVPGALLLKALQAPSLASELPAPLRQRSERLLKELLEACSKDSVSAAVA